MFASFKGEGTGAVRHMFAHHILKPERVPLEANLWGTPKSSGSFQTMFEGRIRRALDYAEDPFELKVVRGNGRKASEKVYGLSAPLGFDIADSYEEFAHGLRVHLSCGDSSQTDIPDRSVDAVITDPPFFDNVHYSQLADFFMFGSVISLGTRGRGAPQQHDLRLKYKMPTQRHLRIGCRSFGLKRIASSSMMACSSSPIITRAARVGTQFSTR